MKKNFAIESFDVVPFMKQKPRRLGPTKVLLFKHDFLIGGKARRHSPTSFWGQQLEKSENIRVGP